MSKFTEQLEHYFNNTPKEKLDADWERIHTQYGYGVDVFEYINTYTGIYTEEKVEEVIVDCNHEVTPCYEYDGGDLFLAA